MDKITIEITDTGVFKIDCDAISPPNHANAEAFVRRMAELAGGKPHQIKKPHAHMHGHIHTGISHSH